MWTNAEDRSVRGRRYQGDSALDIDEIVLSHDSHSASVTAMPDSGDFALSWTGTYQGESGPDDDMAFATFSLLLDAGETVASDSGERVVAVSAEGSCQDYLADASRESILGICIPFI